MTNIRKYGKVGLFFLALLIGAYLYFFKANVPKKLEEPYLYVSTGSDFAAIRANLVDNGFLKDPSNFDLWTQFLGYKKVRPGRFKIQAGMSSYRLIKHLQLGEQAPVKLTLNGLTYVEQFAGKSGKVLENDSLAIIQLLQDSAYLDSIGYTKETLMSLIIPNSYELMWNTSPRALVQRMVREHKHFWNADRTAKAAALNMTPNEVYIMASIVDGETNIASEMPTVAGAYFNRLKINMPLQADPTVQFALMLSQGGGWRRLMYSDYTFPHIYNTYLHRGLPPGPIGMPSVKAIDATLQPESHDYLYFVAQPNNSGGHGFSKTLQEHNVKVAQFQQWMRTRSNS
jgi:UPF0755 protein